MSDPAATATQRYEIRFTGRVQGVGFRHATVQVAGRFDVTGWVRNMVDGSVRCVAEGAADELDRFVAAVQESMAGYVADTDVHKTGPTGEFDGFTIKF